MEKIKNIYGIEFGYKCVDTDRMIDGKPVKRYDIYYIDGENEFPLDYCFSYENIKSFIDNIGKILAPKNNYGNTFFNVIYAKNPESDHRIIERATFIRYDDHMELIHDDGKYIHESFQTEFIDKYVAQYNDDSRLFEQRKSWLHSQSLNEVLSDINKNDKIKEYLLEKEFLPSLYEDLKARFTDEYLDSNDVNQSVYVPTIGKVWILMSNCKLQFHQGGYSLDNLTIRVDNMTNEEIINYIFAGIIKYADKLKSWNTSYGKNQYAEEVYEKEDKPIIRKSEQEILNQIGDPNFYGISDQYDGEVYAISDNSFTIKRTFSGIRPEYKEYPFSSYQGNIDELYEGQRVIIERCTTADYSELFFLVYNGEDYHKRRR